MNSEPGSFEDETLAEDRRLVAVLSQLYRENDRTAAIVAGAHIDDLLLSAIKSRLIEDVKVTDDLFKADGPMGTFANRNKLGLLLGIYSKPLHVELKNFASIRNVFAHQIEVQYFHDEPVKGKCMSFALPETFNQIATGQLPPKILNYYGSNFMSAEERASKLADPKKRFLDTFMILHNWLNNVRINPHRPKWEYDPDKPPPSIGRS